MAPRRAIDIRRRVSRAWSTNRRCDRMTTRKDDVVVPRGARSALVRFPGYVRGDDYGTVERMLGGRDALARACFPRERERRLARASGEMEEDVLRATGGREREARGRDVRNGRLELRFREGDANASATYAERRETRSIVLRMTTYEDESGGSGDGERGERTEVEALGVARRVFVFRGAADFRRSGGARATEEGDALANAMTMKEVKGGANDPFELGREGDATLRGMGAMSLRPPLYTRDDIPVEDYFALRDTGATTTREVDFHEIAVPGRGVEIEGASNEAVNAMRTLMEEREIWSPLAALARLPKRVADEISIRKLHTMMCYQFSTGPFKRLWIKTGVDPRFDRSYVRYQTVTVRLPANWFRDDDEEGAVRKERFSLSSRSDRGYHEAVHGFTSIPDVRHPVLSLADVALPSVRAAVELAATCVDAPSACEERRGWLSPWLYRKIQRAIVRGYQTLLSGGDPIAADEASMGNADEVTADDETRPDSIADDDFGDAANDYAILGDQDDSDDDYD